MKTGLDTQIPNNSAFSINMHYQSESTGEFATFRINKSMTLDDVLGLYARLCPIECRTFLQETEDISKSLNRPGGMSKEGVVMAIGRIPKIVMLMIEFLDPDYFIGAENGIRNFRKFIRAYPKFAVGDHSYKHHSGVLIK